MSNTRGAGVLHNSNVDDVFEHTREDEFLGTKDDVTPLYHGSQNEQLVDTEKGS